MWTADAGRLAAGNRASSVEVSVAGKVEGSAWDAYVSSREDASGYHQWCWRGLFERVFGHETIYLVARRASVAADLVLPASVAPASGPAIVGILPLVSFNSLLFGKFLVSLPFVNYGGVLADDEAAARALVDAARREADRRGATSVELRHTRRMFADLHVKQHKVAMTLALPADAEAAWKGFDNKVRNQIRKAEKSGFETVVGGAELAGDFYAVFARNMRDLGTPVYSRRLFQVGPAVHSRFAGLRGEAERRPGCGGHHHRLPFVGGESLGVVAARASIAEPEHAALLDDARGLDGARVPAVRLRPLDAERGHIPVQEAVGRPGHPVLLGIRGGARPRPPRPQSEELEVLVGRLGVAEAASCAGQCRRPAHCPEHPMSEPAPRPVPLFLEAVDTHSTSRRGEPVTIGVPMPRGLQHSTSSWWVRGHDGRLIPAQFKVLDRWSDGSVRWALADFQADVPAFPGRVELGFDWKEGQGPGDESAVLASREHGALVVRTGPCVFHFAPGGAAPFQVASSDPSAVGPTRVELQVRDRNDASVAVTWGPAAVEEDGPVRACVRVYGQGRTGDGAKLDFTLRCHLYAGSAVARVLLTVRNPRRAAHPGGHWELGDAGSVLLRDVSLVVLPSAPGSTSNCSAELGAPLARAARRLHLYQDSSGGENWQSSNHVNRDGVVPNTFRGYRLDLDDDSISGLRATPVVLIESGTRDPIVAAAIPEFWENFPRAVEADAAHLRVGFWPREYADLHEVQGGEQKTHECYLAFGPDAVTDVPLDWCRHRVVARAAPEWYAEAEAVPYLTPASADPNRAYLELVNAAIEGDDTFFHKRERVDEYGWRHFGDIYGDHEAVRRVGPDPLVSHYNNQYDPVAGFVCQFMRTGDVRWWTQCRQLAAHVVDIDIYHTTEDKAAYNQGLFWHTVHYVDAGKATHRSYPNAPGSHGGGPASEHNYTTGLMLQHFMTGDPTARDAAIGLAQFVIDMDDGSKTVFRWLARGDTGLATQSGSPFYHGPGRGSGNSLNALVDGHRLTGDAIFLRKAVQVIRRAVGPSHDIATLRLDDVERKWFYTMFLQSLGKFLDHMAEREETDGDYVYGQASLLHFARWMAVNEYPYLDKPEILEFPTETWPAQDMRKSEVFKHAAKHATGEERAGFLERARFFFDYSTSTLKQMPTRTLARPVVLLLSHGFMQASFDLAHGPEAPRLGSQEPSGAPDRFVPQKMTAVRRAKMLAAGVGLAALAVAAGLAAWLLR